MMSGQKAFRGAVFHCLADPGERGDAAAAECFDDGLLVIANGRVEALGPAETLLAGLPSGTEVVDYRNRIIVPGLIDTHVHFAQLDIIASHGAQLLDWLESYAYPAEAACADAVHAQALAEAFLDELLRNGTTTALVFATVHPHSVEAIFEAAAARNMRLIAGKVLMDRLCRPDLADDAESGYAESRRLIEKWHGRDRLGYAITPRFALTSSDRQLQLAGKLAGECPEVWVHTHLAENKDEIAAIAELFPGSGGYLDVYASHGLLRQRSVFAHCVHLESVEAQLLGREGGAVAFCPTSNLFLGSGLFDLRAMASAGIRTGLATDIGAGTSPSLLRTMGEAYKVLQLQGQVLPVTRAFYLATLGAARALDLDDCIGNFAAGKEADFVVLDPGASALMARRADASVSIEELLFAMMFLGDERHVAATYVQGVPAAV